jgi:flagellar biosynthesis/type III secretory pathway protein FliH
MDIVERLREHNEPPFDYIAHEAAAKIERLREEVRANKDNDYHQGRSDGEETGYRMGYDDGYKDGLREAEAWAMTMATKMG